MSSAVYRSLNFVLILALLISGGVNTIPVAAKGTAAIIETDSQPRPNAAALAAITVSGPRNVLIGEDFALTVSFKNTGSSVGYGPFVDIVLPSNGADGNAGSAVQDGIEFVSASTLGYTFSTAQNTLFAQKFPVTGAAVTCLSHPWAHQSNGKFADVCGAAGDTFVSLRLPFGGVVPGQPIPPITIDASLSNLADLDVPLNIRSRGGFLYGNNSRDDWCCGDAVIFSNPSPDSPTWPPTKITPKLMLFTKTYNGPDNVQDETASGPNFAHKYTLGVDIAPGQTIKDLDVFDKLPANEQYISLDVAATTPGHAIRSTPSTTLPGGTLDVHYGSATGTTSSSDLAVVFNFYIPRLDASNAPVIDPASGNDVLSKNPAWMTGTWTPGDQRDATQAVASDSICVTGGKCQPLHILQDKAIAIQKSVTDLTDNNPSPGDVLEYTLAFQISDYFSFNGVTITDLISDGQHVQTGFTPRLQINGNGYVLSTAALNAANYDISCNYTGGPGAECTSNNPAANDGSTSFVARISNEIITRGQNGRLIGGCVNPAGGNLATCTPASPGDGPTMGIVIFRTVMQDQFTDSFPSGDKSVDQGDLLTDQAKINGTILDNNTFATRQLEADDATAELSIERKGLSKSLYAINGNTNSSAWQKKAGNIEIKPGDTVTYRMSYALNTSDVEDLALDDYLPLPVFFVNDPDADNNPGHSNGPAFVFDDTVSASAPAVGHAQFGPSDTFRAYSGIVPTLLQNSTQNSLRFTYGDYDNPANTPTTIDLLFTLTVSSEPFADQSFIANQAHESEGSTNNGPFAQDALQWFILTQPALQTTKGVIWSSGAGAVFDPTPVGPVAFSGPASAPRWSGIINSNGLAANPINSNVTGVRAGDTVSFAITIENKGSSLKGAFDIVVRDAIPDIYAIPAGGPNVQIYYGDGTGPISTVVDGVVTQSQCTGTWPGDPCGPDGQANTEDDLFGRGIKLLDPVGQGVCDAYNPNLGNNVILITYDLTVRKNIKPGAYINTGSIGHYSGSTGGTSHVTGGIAWNLHTTDTATASWISASTLANTGFAPQRKTILPEQPAEARYTSMPGEWLEIPTLGVNSSIVGIPNRADGWDLTWLSNQVGYLQGTTPPTAVGNTALTAHVYLADGSPGPFVNLSQLSWGQTIILHADGYRYIYQVRDNRQVYPTDLSVFKEDGYAWLTLLTCKGYNAVSNSYLYRVAVRAILLRVEAE